MFVGQSCETPVRSGASVTCLVQEAMRALVWRGESDIRIEEVDAPEPTSDEVLLRILGAGICGSDVGRFAGRGSSQAPPLILGHEFVGEVVAAAKRAGPSIGDRVAVFPFLTDGTCASCRRGRENLCGSRTLVGGQRPGAFAALVAVPAANCYGLPLSATPELGALVEPLACVLHALQQARIEPSDRVFVFGAGGIGLLLVTAASILGLRRMVVGERSARRRAAAIAAGAELAVDPNVPDEVRPLADGEGFDVVIDAVGTSSTRRQAVDLVRAGGRVVLVGLHDGGVLDVPARRVIRDEVSLVGSFAYLRSSFTEAVAIVNRGLLDEFLASCEIRPLTDGPRSFKELAAGSLGAPRVILRP